MVSYSKHRILPLLSYLSHDFGCFLLPMHVFQKPQKACLLMNRLMGHKRGLINGIQRLGKPMRATHIYCCQDSLYLRQYQSKFRNTFVERLQVAYSQGNQAAWSPSWARQTAEPSDGVRGSCTGLCLLHCKSTNRDKRLRRDRLLILMGGVLPHAFMMPPSKTGTYSTSQLAKTGECWHGESDKE